MRRVDQSLKELEAENETGEDAAPVHLPDELTEKTALREKVRRAMDELSERSEIKQINLTDKDARLMKTRQGIAPCYNAQAMVSPMQTGAGGRGMLITAVEVTDDPDDHSQLVPMLRAAEETTKLRSEMTLGDAGYHSGSNLPAVWAQRAESCDAGGTGPGAGPSLSQGPIRLRPGDRQLHLSARTAAALHPYQGDTWDTDETLPGLGGRLPRVSGLWGVYEG